MTIHAYAALRAKAPLEPFTYDADPLGEFGAEIAISHCGICHSDLHLIDNDWRSSHYPLVPGHEIIGTVKAVGTLVDEALIGERVGVGWQRGSCLSCEWCMTGQEELCSQIIETCIGHYGGFAQQMIMDSRFMHVIPDGLSSENAAPLLCAGVTVYSPLVRYAKPMSRVGVIGIGGLGHLAVQYAAAMGCEVTAFSTRDSKKDEAQELGATHFINGKNNDAMRGIRKSLDVIINTVPANIDLKPYLRTLRPNGVLCFVGSPREPISFRVGYIFANQAVAGSSIGGRQTMRDMLDFSARHKVEAWTEVLPFDSVNTALDRLRENDVRYRFVLEN